MKRTAALFIVLALSVAAFAKDTRKELTVNLKYAPQEGVQSNLPDLAPAMLEKPFQLRVEDARGLPAPLTIGQGTNDDDLSFPVLASADPVLYVKDTLQQIAANWGLKVAEQKQRVLTVRVSRFFVDESNKALGSVYTAEARLTFALTDDGRKLAEGSASGEAHRYGRARSAENINEVLSDALKEAFGDALTNSQLQSAWTSGKTSGGGGGGSTTAKESVEERLRKLDDLLKKKLITKEEYDSKRAEILKDM
ncbi:MAG TPA: hypothetical protein VGR02_12120 [Thermoanaerobaculia bacterium]|jgi:hypothetical protein|nr:hypothetical protein [Thermoanaerobaculia bacterium]